MRKLQNDSKGTAAFLDRTAKGMDERQLYREFVQNGIEAGATSVVIDGWRDPDTGHTLTRITDNGCGMTEDQLVTHLSTLHGQFKSDGNYGIGARIASLPSNPAGVTFASRTANGVEAAVQLIKHEGEYGFREWEIEGEDGYPTSTDVVAPDSGMLNRLSSKSGTVVILHGDGTRSTWDNTVSYQVQRFLSYRYYDFAGKVEVKVHRAGKADQSRLVPIFPLGVALEQFAEAEGDFRFEDVAGLSGEVWWWRLQAGDKKLRDVNLVGGVGLLAESEVFSYSKDYLGDFGVIYPKVKARVAILIWVDGAEMNTERSSLHLPGRGDQGVPWKALGAYFAANMPEEIEELLSSATVASGDFDADMAKLLDEDWMKKLDPVSVKVPAKKGVEKTGGENGTGVKPERNPKGSTSNKPKKRGVQRKGEGNETAEYKIQVVLPRVEFIEGLDSEFGIRWEPSQGVLLIDEEFPPYVREVARWVEQTVYPRSIVEHAVRSAYQVEYAAGIIDANGQDRFKLNGQLIGKEMVEQMNSEASLYRAALGMQALHDKIGTFIRDAVKSADVVEKESDGVPS